jgi:hypothetical protein
LLILTFAFAKGEGGGGRRDGTAQVTFFRRRLRRPPRRFSTSTSALPVLGGGVGHGALARTRPRRAAGFRLRPDAPPLSHPVATARNGGGRTWSRLPGSFGPSSSPEDAAETGNAHPPLSPDERHAAGAAPRSINWPSPVDAPSSSEDEAHHTAGFGEGDKGRDPARKSVARAGISWPM